MRRRMRVPEYVVATVTSGVLVGIIVGSSSAAYAEDEAPLSPAMTAKWGQVDPSTKGKKRNNRPHVHGRIMIDAASYRPDQTALGAGTDISSARIGVRGRLDSDWRYRLDYELSGSGSLKGAYLSRRLGGHRSIVIGNVQVPFSLEELTGSSSKTFMERALPNAFSPSYRPGVGFAYRHPHSTLSVDLFGDSLNASRPNKKTSGNEGGGLAGRLVFADIPRDDRVLHAGLSAMMLLPDADRTARFRSYPEARLNATRLLNTKTIHDVRYTAVLGAEGAAVRGPLSLQGEYMKARVVRKDGFSSLPLSGWYVYVSYFLTGEHRPYRKGGVFGAPIPDGDGGAWEIAMRRSALDLDGGAISGGTEYNTTLGVNYYLNPAMRVMVNYIWVDVSGSGSTPVEESPTALTMRFQMGF